MIVGRFGATSGRPYVEGRLTLRRFRISADVSFILDTGADMTVLMPADASRLGVDFAKLDTPCQSQGIGGYSSDFLERALITFLDSSGSLFTFGIDLVISTPSPDIMTVPSLLGRNVIDRWRVVYDPTDGRLEAEVRSFDVEIPAGR